MAWGASRRCVIDDYLPRLTTNDPSLTSLVVLPFRTLSADGVNRLAAVLVTNTTLTEFYCSGHTISEIGAKNLGHALQSNRALRRLTVGPVCVPPLVTPLATNHTLETLDLQRSFGDDDMAWCSIGDMLQRNRGLTDLNLSHNSIGIVGATALQKGLSINEGHLRILDISGCNLSPSTTRVLMTHPSSAPSSTETTPAGACLSTGCCGIQHLKSLILNSNPIGDDGIQVLGEAIGKPCSTVTSLSLQECTDVTLAGMSAFVNGLCQTPSMSHLTSLNLSGMNLSDTILLPLCTFLSSPTCRIETLLLSENTVTSTFCEQLVRQGVPASLRTLDLGYNHLTAPAIACLVTSTMCTTLEFLRLAGNAYHDDGIQAFLSGRQQFSRLQHLDLGVCMITAQGFSSLTSAILQHPPLFPSLTVLECGGNNIANREQWEASARLLENIYPQSTSQSSRAGVRKPLQVTWHARPDGDGGCGGETERGPRLEVGPDGPHWVTDETLTDADLAPAPLA